MMDAPDEVIHQSLRLRIMATLAALHGSEQMEFARLRNILASTDGNLGAHLATLEGAGYVTVEKAFVARKPRTSIAMTVKGREAFTRHVGYLRRLLDAPLNAQAAE